MLLEDDAHELAARAHAGLVEELLQHRLDGALRGAEDGRDLLVRQSIEHAAQHLPLPGGEAGTLGTLLARRFRDRGRLMPEGLTYVNSWVAADLGRCFQLMESDDVTLLQRWVAEWSDLADFEIVPVTAGKSTAGALAELL